MTLRLRLLLALAVFFVSAAASRAARADTPLDGTWTAGPLKEAYTVQKWLSGCGPAPVSGSSGGGESITIRQEGDELSFVGGGRVFHTNQCYDQMPTLVRETHTKDANGKTWRTRCVTPPSDPRRGAIDTRVDITTAKHIDIQESGRYEITLNDGKCTADIKRTRGFDLVTPAAPVDTTPAPAPAPEKTAAPPPENVCSSPGDPARLEARPSRKLLRTGDTFAFRAIVLDASGCATRSPTTWALGDPATGGKGVALEPNGKVTIAPDAAEGTYELIASGAGKSTRVTVEVASPSRYDDLLAASGLNDAGESEGASIAMIAGETLGGGDARVEDGSSRRRTAFLAIVLATAFALGVVAFIGARRSRRAAAIEREAQERHAERVREAEERRTAKRAKHAAAVRAHEESLVEAARLSEADLAAAPAASRMICPACRREYDAESLYCSQDSNRLVPLNAPAEAGPLGSICPTCKRGYDPGISVCPHDKDELIPYALYASRNPQAPAPARGKICPTCGGRFDGNASFCGKDGTALVLLN